MKSESLHSEDSLRVYGDLRSAVKDIAAGSDALYVVYTLPSFSVLYDKQYSYNRQTLNPQKLECTCEYNVTMQNECKTPRDIRAVCRHLYRFIAKRVVLDSLTKAILERQIKFGPVRLLRREYEGKAYYFGIENRAAVEWMDVYAPSSAKHGEYLRYGYNVPEDRWAYNVHADDKDRIESAIKTLVRFLREP